MKTKAIVFLLFTTLFFSCNKKTSNYDEFNNKLDSLQSEVYHLYELKDSLSHKVDTIRIEKIINQRIYEETRNTIINNSTSEDLQFFTNYINKNRARIDSINNNR